MDARAERALELEWTRVPHRWARQTAAAPDDAARSAMVVQTAAASAAKQLVGVPVGTTVDYAYAQAILDAYELLDSIASWLPRIAAWCVFKRDEALTGKGTHVHLQVACHSERQARSFCRPLSVAHAKRQGYDTGTQWVAELSSAPITKFCTPEATPAAYIRSIGWK